MFLDYLLVSVLMMRAKPVRSILSLLGIYVGVLALIVILSIHEGARKRIEDLYRIEGVRVILVMPSFDQVTMRMGSLTLEHVGRLASTAGVHSVLPHLTAEKDVRSQKEATKAQLLGVDADFIPIYRIPVQEGRIFLPAEVTQRQPVCILTQKGAKKLFPVGHAVGQILDISGHPFEVIGVVQWTPALSHRIFMGSRQDALVPSTWLLQHNEQKDRPMMISMLEVRANPNIPTEQMIENIRATLSHGDAKRSKLYSVESLEHYVQGSREASERMLRSLLAIAAVSLLVGGIGIANVMLTSVTERTREVGIRKALGARRQDILFQFLVESSVLSASGGLLAAVSGIISIAVVPVFVHSTTLLIVPRLPVAACLVLTLVIGLVAGVYPASRAAHLSPAEALRYE